DYRSTCGILTRRTNPSFHPLEDGITIAKQGQMVRFLGCFIGNGIDLQGPWRNILDAVRRKAALWSKKALSLTGKCMVVLSIYGGMTQYLSTVQGMPEQVETELTGSSASSSGTATANIS
ncbi:hypothetical protein BKA62DRAFT_627264, partial [Auriculariales sp. MPI-PUGE-AT-0066]